MTDSHSYPEGAALRQVYDALCQAQDCIRGETPEDISDEAAREDTIDKIRDAMRAIEAMQSRGVAQASREAVIEECARVVEPKGPRPCQCDCCFCGNIGVVEAVAAWDADMANARAIRALALSSTDRP